MGPSVPQILRGDVSPKWDHLCPKCKILPGSNYYCAWRDYFASLLFSPVSSVVSFCLYILLFDLFFFACLSVFTQVGPSVSKIFRDDFFMRMGPSVPEILRGDVSPKWDHLCPKRKILHRSNYYCAWRDYFANSLFFPASSTVCFCLYMFLFDFFTRMGPSVPEILGGDFSPKWVHLCRRYLTVIFSGVIFSLKCECALLYLRPSVPEILIGVIFYTQ